MHRMSEHDSPSKLPEPNALGRILRERREQLGKTQEEVADAVGVTQESVGKIELGKTRAPRPLTLQRLASFLRLDIADLYLALGRANDHASAQRLADADMDHDDEDPLLDAIMLDVRRLTPEGRRRARELVVMIRMTEANSPDGGSST